MNFEQRQLMRDIFANIDHEAVASEVLGPEHYAEAEAAIYHLITSEASLDYAGENIMQRIVDSLGGEGAAGGTYQSAFFGGALLALATADVLACRKLGDSMKYRELWLSKSDVFFASIFDEIGVVDVHVAAANTHTLETEVAYDDAIERIAPTLVQSEEESELLYAGFAHILASAKSCIAELVQQAIDDESKNAEWNFEDFLKDNDLTGNLQEVHRSYLEHCDLLGIADPYHNSASEEQIRQLLSMTMRDYEQAIVEMKKIEIEGPLFITTTSSSEFDQNSEADVVILEAGVKIIGTPGMMGLSLVPTDEYYVGCESDKELRLRYAPSFVFSDALLKHPDGEIEPFSSEQYVYVGFSVPLAKYRSILE